MPIEAVVQNSVVLANQVNPSIFTPEWIADQRLFPLDALRPGTIIAPNLVQLSTEDFHLTVIPDRIQLSPICDEARQSQIVQTIMGGIVRLLPHTPYSSAGVNFSYLIRYADHAEFSRRNRELFFHQTVFGPFFGNEDAKFGAYYSQDYLGCRLKVNMKPAHETDNPENAFHQFDFNFHKDIERERASEQIDALLAIWNDARDLARRIAEAAQ